MVIVNLLKVQRQTMEVAGPLLWLQEEELFVSEYGHTIKRQYSKT